MEMEGGSTSGSVGEGAQVTRQFSPARSRAFYRFTQQNLPACKPVLTPGCVITIFLLMGIVLTPVGLVCLRASESVVEIVNRYDIECIPVPYRSNKVAYIRDSSISKNCTLKIKVENRMKAPIYIYYELDNYYQNHRRYVKSRSDKQLRHGLEYKDTSSCKPEEKSNGLPIHKFGKNVYPFNFQNGTLIGGGKLNPKVPLSEQEDLIVWMRAAALPKFRKLYGVIEENLEANEVIEVRVANNYNTYSFGERKSLSSRHQTGWEAKTISSG
uniref:ALA-interacting subunit n=1 Tax=Ananas comosus var. bracteatus TaxID=296719 RepID=A0A6V7QF41_ANACO|nr:unnamed protein product [Ananas comosus var. bracteatus]